MDDEYPALQQAWKICVDEGLTYVDNAQAYSSMENEKIHGSLVKGLPRSSYFIQTKWYVSPDNTTNIFSPSSGLAKLLKGSLERFGVDYVDVYFMHRPIHLSSISQAAKELTEFADVGMAETIGWPTTLRMIC